MINFRCRESFQVSASTTRFQSISAHRIGNTPRWRRRCASTRPSKIVSRFDVSHTRGGAMATTSYAALITYSTLGRFDGGAFATSPTITVGGGSITFTALGSTSVDPGNISYGTFDSNAVGSGGMIPVGTTFDLQVNQTTPSVGSATASATLSGTITTTSSTVRLVFSTTTFTIGQRAR